MSSPPPTPSSEPPTKKQCRFKETGFPSEWAEDYRPGGFHPVHFGDKLKNGRYHIIRKLGDGSFSTVWLATDTKRSKYVALKIPLSSSKAVSTEISICNFLDAHSGGDPLAKYVTSLLETFEIKGPNGSHCCLVFEPMGSSVASMVEQLPSNQNRGMYHNPYYPKEMAVKILRHAISGLTFLHKHGIVHGDVQGGNMLFNISDLDSVDEQQLQHDKSKISKPLRRRDGKTDCWGPKYLAIPQSLHEHVDLGSSMMVKVSDLGSAFWKSSPPQSTVTPIALRAPELIFEEQFGPEIDVWAFGCLIYELLTGVQLFSVVLMGDDKLEDANDDHILDLIDVLGPLPDRLMSKWPRKEKWIGPDGERLNPYSHSDGYQASSDPDQASESGESEVESDQLSDDEDENNASGEGHRDRVSHHPGSPLPAESVSSGHEVTEQPYVPLALEERFEKYMPKGMDKDERNQVTQLIREILQYDPAKRPTAEQLLQHPWFLES